MEEEEEEEVKEGEEEVVVVAVVAVVVVVVVVKEKAEDGCDTMDLNASRPSSSAAPRLPVNHRNVQARRGGQRAAVNAAATG